jgi:flavin reductase (DIM6/NTAB) family NADH-FMN oxidoreductase RutF/rhodanese-related sulfurtransferase
LEFDLEKLAPGNRYKLLTGVVVPRPIAWVTSLDENGVVNAAPFSYFNMMGSDPPIVAFGPSWHADGRPKDTAHNIRITGEFVINMVDESLAQQMNLTAIDFPRGISEIEMARLELIPSYRVKVPRIAAAPVQLECREHATIEIRNTRIVLGEVLHLRIRDDLVNAERFHVNAPAMKLIGRMHGGGWYSKTSELFEMPRVHYQQWQAQREISRDELKLLIESSTEIYLVDALMEPYYRHSHLPGAINIPADKTAQRAAELLPDKTCPVVVYCLNDGCEAAPRAAKTLRELGYENVREYKGGRDDWRAAGLPLEGQSRSLKGS